MLENTITKSSYKPRGRINSQLCARFRTGAAFLTASLLVLALTGPAFAYQPSSHQQLTFSAARHLNACAEQLGIQPLTPLQVRYIAKANVKQASPGFFKSLVRWNYYERNSQLERTAIGVVNTRMHDEFNDVIRDMSRQKDAAKKYAQLGRIVSYIQDMTSPAHVVPIFYTRFWRFNITDRFNAYSIESSQVESLISDMCGFANDNSEFNLLDVLIMTADKTLDAVQAQVEGLPTSWQAFWELDEQAEDWGEYGVAGNNFGRKVDFRCGEQKCILLNDDPLYREFATQRHLQAVKSTFLALYWMQRSVIQTPLKAAAGRRSFPTTR